MDTLEDQLATNKRLAQTKELQHTKMQKKLAALKEDHDAHSGRVAKVEGELASERKALESLQGESGSSSAELKVLRAEKTQHGRGLKKLQVGQSYHITLCGLGLQNGANNRGLGCVSHPSTTGAGCKTRLESIINKCKSRAMYDCRMNCRQPRSSWQSGPITRR